MTPQEFKQWQIAMGFSSQQQAADALGLSKSVIEMYESGRRRDNGQAVVIPRVVALACGALRAETGYSLSLEDRVQQWHDAAQCKYFAQLDEWQIGLELPERHYQLSYGIGHEEGQKLDLGRLIEELRLINDEVKQSVHRFDWSMFHIFGRSEMLPRYMNDANSGLGEDDFLECSLIRPSQTGATDFWRVSCDGRATIIRGYFEDRPETVAHFGTKPGAFLSPNWLVRDVAEVVHHARALATRFSDSTAVSFRCSWAGLRARVIFDPMSLWLPGAYSFDADTPHRVSTGTWRVADLSSKWPEVIAAIVAPVMRVARCDHVITPDWVRGQEGRWRAYG